jgi:DNA-3-methyladenine glycosylase I
MSEVIRCGWAGDDPLYVAYHDTEWGVPVRDDLELFDRLMLEGFQAGLAWITILRKREHFHRAFDGWNPERIARYGDADIDRLMADPGIIRNRLKINGAVKNARAYLALREAGESFSDILWSFVGGEPHINEPRTLAEVPAFTPEAEAMSKDLKRRGFTFVGPTICYAFMQSAGLVDDHIVGCVSKTALPASAGPSSSSTDA